MFAVKFLEFVFSLKFQELVTWQSAAGVYILVWEGWGEVLPPTSPQRTTIHGRLLRKQVQTYLSIHTYLPGRRDSLRPLQMATGHKHGRGPCRKFWLGTENNPKEDSLLSRLEKEPLLPVGVTYLAFQLEEGENGTPHYQVYIELERGQHISWLKGNISETAHWEARRGTGAEASLYCTKDDTRVRGPWVIGEMSMGAGARTDLIHFRDAIQSGKRK